MQQSTLPSIILTAAAFCRGSLDQKIVKAETIIVNIRFRSWGRGAGSHKIGISRASIAAMTLSHKPECINEAR